ncbi:heparin lyase I family protein [Novosphingobium sp. BL-8A]|uniref:heparin lyase I family protein n=1 Tax=Novosphingobium sp. BL-8A TaxID=3127639 RepID=UPI003756667B
MAYIAEQPSVIIDQAAYAVSAGSPRSVWREQDGACLIFTVRPGDVAHYDRVRKRPYERAEVISIRPFTFGETNTISFQQYIAPGSAASNDRPAVIGQIHNTGGQTGHPQPFVAMQIIGERQRIITFSGGRTQDVRKSTAQWVGAVERGRWVRWVWEFKADRAETRFQAWRDGIQLFPSALNLGGYEGPRGPYWQFGIYRSKDLATMRVAYADVSLRKASLGSRVANFSAPTCPVQAVK